MPTTKRQNLTARRIVREIELRRSDMRKLGVSRIGLFGSYLKGKPKKASDLDFLVEFRRPAFDDYLDLKSLLERTFNKKVDLVVEHTLKPALRYVKAEALYAKV